MNETESSEFWPEMRKTTALDLDHFRVRNPRPNILIGTASDRYSGWSGLNRVSVSVGVNSGLGLYSCHFLRMGGGLIHVETFSDNEGKKRAKDKTWPPRPMLEKLIAGRTEPL